MIFLLKIFRHIFYIPFALYCFFRLCFIEKFNLIDLDYSLCRNDLVDENYDNYHYLKYDLKINYELKKILEDSNKKGFSNVIFSARGIRAVSHSKKWLKLNGIKYSLLFHIGETWLKIIPIVLLFMLSKQFTLYDDLSDEKEKDSKKNNIQKIIMHLSQKKNFIWIDPQN